MNILLLCRETTDDFPKSIHVYKDNTLIDTVSMTNENNIRLESDKSIIKLIIKNDFGLNKKEKFIAFIVYIMSYVFCVNGTEAFNWMMTYEVCFEPNSNEVKVEYTGDLTTPFKVKSANVLKNYSYVEKSIYNKWLLLTVTPIILILGFITLIFISISNILIKSIGFLFVASYLTYLLFKIKKIKNKVKL